MKITDVEVRVGVTVNIGNYESVRADYSARAVLEEGDAAKDAIDKCRTYLSDKIKKDLDASEGGRKFLSL